ncbi:MATE family efflux transporter [Hylemonella gracilis]|uniref:MATE family efflux transporter n=1 Tax=Hylemonella gracilis TaxID=80880 RepID=UPI000552DD8B|nr:MATE family efflux transporter [Hylemonella gracilis]
MTEARKSELGIVTRHALTVLAGQLATIAYGVTDTLVAGRYSEASLAALSVGAAIYMSVYVSLMGVLQALLPVWAELHGASRREGGEAAAANRNLGHSLRQSIYLWAGLSLLGMTLLLTPGPLLAWAEVPPALRGEVTHYLTVLALALPVALLFRLFATLNQSLGHPQLVTWLQLGSLGLKIPLSLWFAWGGLGLNPQGAAGCAWATLVTQLVLLLLALWLLRTRPLYRPYQLWHRPGRPDGRVLAGFLRMGLPSGLSILVEVTSFTLMALFVARLGTAAAASHQIAANVASVLYMMPLAIGIASSARTSYWLGANQPARARQAVRIGLGLVAGSALLLAALLALSRGPLAALYAPSTETLALATPLLAWVALYHLFDGLQSLGAFLLRCWRITVTPLLIYGVLLWGLGLYGGYRLAYTGLGPWPAMATPAAFWASGAAALLLAASAFWFMLWRLLRKT